MSEYQKERQKISLKPCPFCGGEARLRKHQKLEQTWYVQCNQCGIRTPNSIQVPYESWKDAMNYPVQLWNRRAENRNDDYEIPRQSCEDIAKAFQFGLAFGFGKRHDEMDKVIDEIKKVITPQEPKTGHWEWLTEDKYRCSNCNHETRVDECMNKPMYDFCPFCGVKMAGSEDKE